MHGVETTSEHCFGLLSDLLLKVSSQIKSFCVIIQFLVFIFISYSYVFVIIIIIIIIIL